MRAIYRGPIASVTLKGQAYHLTPGAELDLPDCRYVRGLLERGLLVRPLAPPGPSTEKAPRSRGGRRSRLHPALADGNETPPPPPSGEQKPEVTP